MTYKITCLSTECPERIGGDCKHQCMENRPITGAPGSGTSIVNGSPGSTMPPMGISEWRDYGKKYGYWDYFAKEVAAETATDTLLEELEMSAKRQRLAVAEALEQHKVEDRGCWSCQLDQAKAKAAMDGAAKVRNAVAETGIMNTLSGETARQFIACHSAARVAEEAVRKEYEV